MPKLIKNNQVIDDSWQLITKDAELPADDIAAGKHLILPLQLWQENTEKLQNKKNIGLWLDSDQAPNEIESYCNSIPLIAINFPVFSDGRGYSYARQLREYFDYQGELRAIGDILKDQLFFYQRCGFNSFALREDRDAEQAISSLTDFSVSYQSANDSAVPVFQRR